MCYTYDSLNRVTKRQVISLGCDCVLSEENYTYDAAGNITDAPNSCFEYDINNRLITFNGNTVSYDMDGNMLSNGYINCEFDSGNRLISAGGHTYTYNAEDVRIRNLCADADTTYTYNTNCKLSQLLTKTTNGITTKYVYGLGLIGEEKEGCFKTYHFDYRGSTVGITDESGNIIDTLKYDTYGNVTEHIGDSFVIFGYNGRDGVVTDRNGLLHMRARYYSPAIRRFVNADILHGEISDSTSLNRYSYVNGNPVSFVDPFGLVADDKSSNNSKYNKSNYWVDSYDAIYVSVYSLDVVGHAYVFLKDKNGKWIKTEFNTTGGENIEEKKLNAIVSIERNFTSEQVNFILIRGIRNAAMSGGYTSGIFTEGLEFFPISGDFSESIKLAEEYEGTNYNGYHFTGNNCLYYVREILRAGTADDDDIENVLNNSEQIAPKGFINELQSES